jgi:hypothetical protein
MVAMTNSGLLEWHAAGRALADPAEGVESGDAHVVESFHDGVLVGTIDGLGHGTAAAEAAQMAVRTAAANARAPVTRLIEDCHGALRATRGAAVTLASFCAVTSQMTWTGVGNVDALLLRADPLREPRREALTPRGGIVGYRLPPLKATSIPVWRGDTLILTTDGIRSDFSSGVARPGNPREIAEAILHEFARSSDDALVVVARWLGGAQ